MDRHEPADVALVERWFEAWAAAITYWSEHYGRGCCVDLWDVEATADAIAAVPAEVLAEREWTRGAR